MTARRLAALLASFLLPTFAPAQTLSPQEAVKRMLEMWHDGPPKTRRSQPHS